MSAAEDMQDQSSCICTIVVQSRARGSDESWFAGLALGLSHSDGRVGEAGLLNSRAMSAIMTKHDNGGALERNRSDILQRVAARR